jgi:hypothetical protein
VRSIRLSVPTPRDSTTIDVLDRSADPVGAALRAGWESGQVRERTARLWASVDAIRLVHVGAGPPVGYVYAYDADPRARTCWVGCAFEPGVHRSVVPLLGVSLFTELLLLGFDAAWVCFSIRSERLAGLESVLQLPGITSFGTVRDRFGPGSDEHLCGFDRDDWLECVRPRLRDLERQDGLSSEGSRVSRSWTVDRLQAHLVEVMGLRGVDGLSSFDSLQVLEVVVEVERLAGVDAIPDVPPALRSVGDAHRYLLSLLHPGRCG